MTESSQPTLSHNAERRQYELHLNGELVALAAYTLSGGTVVLNHTETAPAHQGQGYAAQVMEFALNDVRSQGLRANPQCSFAAQFVADHPEYADLVAR
ncbi:GNAT family N-acetyltransferase [Deinococcus enclensis]|uniref:GNAT family acetyltransferase n=1 Tax=Deinococcus enclensis TaxID=1049582 RepID=A0ABT9M8I4_9DEIO|nr:GNAT family N-acetyltransferase [Deinococcus enclensis]MDP9762890.1 putative GNAT family acetyltransferase [Deinococcus enclensis]